MIVWTGEGTLLDTTGPHHTLTIQKKIHIRHYEANIHDWSYLSQGSGSLVQAYGGSPMEQQTYKKASKVLKRFVLNM